MLQLNGQAGGGQMLRTALSLSMATGQAFRMTGIRAGRPRPGLMRQHLTCVKAAVEVSGGCADGAEPGSTEIVFRPDKVTGGEYRYAIGTAGSTTLLLQTLLPAFWGARTSARLRLEGGTHNPMAPPAEFVDQVWRPLMARLGADFQFQLVETGFAPAGGGVIEVTVPVRGEWRDFSLTERGDLVDCRVVARRRGLNESIGERMLDSAAAGLGWDRKEQIALARGPGQGIVCQAVALHEHITEIASVFGEQGVSSETLGQRLAKIMRDYLGSKAPVGRCLADQLLLPMALAGGGRFVTISPDNHFSTNAEVIRRFLDVAIAATRLPDGRWMVVVG